MADIAVLRAGLAANLSAIPGCQVSAYMLGSPTFPTLWVVPDEAEYDKTMGRGHDDEFFVVQALCGTPSDIGAQKTMDKFLSDGAYSVKDAIESDGTLGGEAQDVHVTRREGYRTLNVEGRGLTLVCEWKVRILAPGT